MSDDIRAYPTGDDLIDQLAEFMGDRLPALLGPVPQPRNGKPSLAEDWWVADQMRRNISFPYGKTREDGFRACYRWARKQNVERMFERGYLQSEAAADLLLHQASELTPALFIAARQIGAAGYGQKVVVR